MIPERCRPVSGSLALVRHCLFSVCPVERSGAPGAFPAHALSGQVDTRGVVDEAVQDGVGVGWITKRRQMPRRWMASSLWSRSLTLAVPFMGSNWQFHLLRVPMALGSSRLPCRMGADA